MSLPIILFYGPSGFEARILESYLTASGYEARFFTTADEMLASIEAHPTAVAVIAAEKTPLELVALARQVRARSGRGRIFLLTDEQPFPTDLKGVEIIARPFRLSALVHRLRDLTADGGAPAS